MITFQYCQKLEFVLFQHSSSIDAGDQQTKLRMPKKGITSTSYGKKVVTQEVKRKTYGRSAVLPKTRLHQIPINTTIVYQHKTIINTNCGWVYLHICTIADEK